MMMIDDEGRRYPAENFPEDWDPDADRDEGARANPGGSAAAPSKIRERAASEQGDRLVADGARPLDETLRRLIPVTQSAGVQLRIDKLVGFELFNTRPYHNHETWSTGYRVLGPVDGSGWIPLPAFLDRARELGLDEGQAAELFAIAAGMPRSNLLVVKREFLGEAIETWFTRRARVTEILDETPPGPNQRTRLAVLGYHYPDGERR